MFRMRRLTVWFTSPINTARLLNNSEVRHLTLIYCGAGGAKESPAVSPEGHFAVQHLERLTVLKRPHRPCHNCPDGNSDPDIDNAGHLDMNRCYISKEGDTNLDLFLDVNKDYLTLSTDKVQDIFLGRELGAAYHEQARLGIIHSSVLELGAELKAYTVQTHIDSDGTLPFPNLHLPKLPETSVIYVSFVY